MKTRFAILTFALTIPAFAQINYDEVNHRTEETRRQDSSTKFSEGLNKLNNFLDELLIPDVHLKLAKPMRKLTELEQEQAKLLKCVRTLLTKVKGGYDAPKVTVAVIGPEFPSDEDKILEAVNRCEEANQNLVGLRSFDRDKMIKAIDAVDASPKLKILIGKFIMPQEKCIVRTLTAQGAIVVGAGAGVGVLSCLSTNGKVTNYFGPAIRGNVGVGALVSFSNHDSKTSKHTNGKFIRFASSGEPDFEGETNIAIGIGTDQPMTRSTSRNINLGLGGTVGYNGLAGIRVFNGKSRWDLILDTLK